MLLAIILCLLVGIWIHFSSVFKSDEIPSYWIPSSLFLKFTAGLFLWYVYTYFYTDRASSDIFKYFDDAKYLFQNTKDRLGLRWELLISNSTSTEIAELISGTQHWDRADSSPTNDNPIMIRIHLILYHLSRGNFHIHTLFFSIISFIGSWSLFQFFKNESKLNHKLIWIASFMAPSLLFWASAPLKESWLIFILGVFLYALSSITKKISVLSSFVFIITLLCLLSLKSYIILSLFLGILFFLFSKKVGSKNWNKLFMIIHLSGAVIFFFLRDKTIAILSEKQLAFKDLIVEVGAKSKVYLPSFHDLESMILSLPIALYNVYIHPLIPNYFNPLSSLASIEHLIYVLLLFFPFFFKRKIDLHEKRLALFCCSFLLIAGAIIGLTTPILGAIVRYKSPLIPFYLILLFIFVDFKPIVKLFSKK